jgi:hypothetical protein
MWESGGHTSRFSNQKKDGLDGFCPTHRFNLTKNMAGMPPNENQSK